MADGAAPSLAIDTTPREPPIADLDAEREILGALSLDHDALYRIVDLEPEDFYQPAHGLVYRAAQESNAYQRRADRLFNGEATAEDLEWARRTLGV